MTYDELVEAVAKKLWLLEAKKYVIAWEDESPKKRDAYRADARAIIPIVQEACAKVAD